jgi:type VII secretion-associated serine protease mycosin
VVVAALGLAVPYAPAPAAAGCTIQSQVQRVPKPTQVPWPQQRWGLDRLAALDVTGKDITVAVIDSGVNARHPQLHGHVLPGWDALPPRTGTGQEDCVGHGTAVASLIAAQPAPADTPFRGLAPGVKILPIRASESTDSNPNGRGSPEDLAKAIEKAVGLQPEVISLSLVLSADDPAVHAAINHARDKNIVVVAAVGNFHNRNGGKDPTPYPAAYDGVIGVGAIDENGQRYEHSQTGDYVKLVAPGNQIYAAAPDGGYQIQSGTSMAAPFVAATAALIIEKYKPISASDVAKRLFATADPAPGGPGSPEYGQGMVNPYRAVTEIVSNDPPAKLPPLPQVQRDPKAAAATAAAADRRRVVALWLAVSCGGVALLVVFLAGVVSAGRQRGWRPGT